MDGRSPTSGEADWFYALNSFQYRVYGDGVTVDGQPHGTMTIEIYKRYNFGNISRGQQRSVLHAKVPGLGVTAFSFSQNDLAHLNTVGLTQNYDVVGVATEGF